MLYYDKLKSLLSDLVTYEQLVGIINVFYDYCESMSHSGLVFFVGKISAPLSNSEVDFE